MKTQHKLLLALAASGLAFSSASVALIASTSFGGTAAAPTGDTGFSSSKWASTAGGATASSATFTAGDMSGTIPSAYTASGFTNSGNYIQTYNSPAFATLSNELHHRSQSVRILPISASTRVAAQTRRNSSTNSVSVPRMQTSPPSPNLRR